MAAGANILLKRKAGAFVGGDLTAGEAGIDTTNGDVYFSTDGITVAHIDVSQIGAGGGGGGALDWSVRNESGSTLTKGTPVAFSSYGAGASKPLIVAATSASSNTARAMGLVKTDITNNSNGDVVTEGELSGLDTSYWADGTVLYPGVSGGLSSIPGPFSRATCIVIYSHATNGIVYVLPSMPVHQLGTGVPAEQFIYSGSQPLADAELSIGGLYFDSFAHFRVEIPLVEVDTDATDVKFNFTNGGTSITSTYNGGGQYAAFNSGTNGAIQYDGSTHCYLGKSTSSAADHGLRNLILRLYKLQGFLNVRWETDLFHSSGTDYHITGSMHVAASSADGIRITPATGNLVGGITWNVFGTKVA